MSVVQFDPDLVLVACGLDAARGDPLVSTMAMHSMCMPCSHTLRVDITSHQRGMLTWPTSCVGWQKVE